MLTHTHKHVSSHKSNYSIFKQFLSRTCLKSVFCAKFPSRAVMVLVSQTHMTTCLHTHHSSLPSITGCYQCALSLCSLMMKKMELHARVPALEQIFRSFFLGRRGWHGVLSKCGLVSLCSFFLSTCFGFQTQFFH